MVREITFKQEGAEVTKPFLFSFRAIKDLQKAGIKTEDTLEQLQKCAYLGFYYGHLKKSLAVDFTEDTVGEWMEDDLTLAASVTENVGESMGLFEQAMQGKQKMKVSKT